MKKILSSFCLLFYLCTHCSVAFAQKDFYIPKALLTPLHNNQQQLFTSVGIGGGLNASISYSLSRHIAVFATGTLDKGTQKKLPLLSATATILLPTTMCLLMGQNILPT